MGKLNSRRQTEGEARAAYRILMGIKSLRKYRNMRKENSITYARK
jgi:hypothetical protein